MSAKHFGPNPHFPTLEDIPQYELSPSPAQIYANSITSAQYAVQIRRYEALREQVESAVNWIDLGHPEQAREALLKAIGR